MYKIINVAENNVEVYIKKETLTDIKGKTFDVWEKEKSYGIDVVNAELETIATQKDELNPVKAEAKICNLNEKETMLLEVKKQLEKKR